MKNAKKHFIMMLSLLTGLGGITASAQNKIPKMLEKPEPVAATVMKAGANVASKTAYAWVTRDRGALEKGIVSFDISQPQSLTSLFPLPNKAYAGAYGIDKYYFYRYADDPENETMNPLAFSSVDLKTGAVTDIADWSNADFICNDMTYDYTSGSIYALCRAVYTDNILGFSIQYSKIIKINPQTGTYTEVKSFLSDYSGLSNPTYLTLACDMDGKLYSINIAGQLVTFDKTDDYKEKIIGSTGFSPGTYLQCMEFDHTTDRLYWAADYKNRVSNFCIVDTKTGKATEIGNLGNDSRIAGLYIPFDMPQSGAPAAASGFSVKPAAGGELKAELAWTNPSMTFDNKALTSIKSVKVMRAGQVIKEFSAPTKGADMQFTDDAVPANGLYEYTVVATNAVGEGKSAVQETWVGKDIPAAVSKLGIEVLADGSAKLSWTAPTVGGHGGFLDTSSLKYTVTRYPDGTVVGNDVTDCEFTDNSIAALGKYYYTVQAKNNEGDGYEARSADVYAGNKARLPYACAFDSRGEFASWFVIDNNNDESTWEWKSLTIAGNTKGYAMYTYNNKNDGDDYLISPVFGLKKDHNYRLSFGYKAGNQTYKETFDVRIGKGRTAEAQSKVLKEYAVQTGDLLTASLPFTADEDGEYSFSFHATSPKGCLKLYITDVKLIDETEPTPEPTELEAPYNLKATLGTDNNVTLTWNRENTEETADIFDDFETYESFAVNPTGKYKWNYIDGDNGMPFYGFDDGFTSAALKQPCAAIIINSDACAGSMLIESNPPYSGKNYLLFRSNFSNADGGSPAPVADDWFISPKLSFNENFVFSFYAKSDPDDSEEEAEWRWDKEEIRVGYSTTDMEKDSFKWLTDKNEVIMSEWKQHAYEIPAEAKYVCIHYLTPKNGYLMSVDDVFIGKADSPLRSRKAAAPTLKQYNVYLDGAQVGHTTETTYDLGKVAAGKHTASVVAVYAEGESEAATVEFDISTTGINSAETAAPCIYPNPAADVVFFGTTVDKAEVFNLAGGMEKAYAENAASMDVSTLQPGLYVLRTTIGGKSCSQRLVIRR